MSLGCEGKGLAQLEARGSNAYNAHKHQGCADDTLKAQGPGMENTIHRMKAMAAICTIVKRYSGRLSMDVFLCSFGAVDDSCSIDSYSTRPWRTAWMKSV